MKKTTYVLIALVGALFAGLFLFLLFLSFHPSDNKWDIVKIEGNVQEKTLSDFSRIEVIDSMDEYYFYDDNYGKTLSPIFCISVSDSVSAPSISMKEGWKEFISYAVADSTLTVTFKSTNKDISVQDTPVVITVPSLSYAKLNYRGKTKISGVTSKNLKIDALYHLYLDSISADSVELKFMDTESLVSLDVNRSHIGKLDCKNIGELLLHNHSEIANMNFFGTENLTKCSVDLNGKQPSGLATFPSKNQKFELILNGACNLNFQ